MSTTGPVLLLAGGGKMGGALLDGWIGQGLAAAGIHVVEVSEDRRRQLEAKHAIVAVADAGGLAAGLAPDVVVFAVKPQTMDAVVPAYARFANPATTFLSIAAGRTIRSFENHLGAAAAIVRAMPNTPAAVGRGITVACPNEHVDAAAIRLCHRLLEAVGEVAWIDDEGQMDAVTALSGGGPAYVFLLAECMAKAGQAAGLPEALAARLARVTVAGAGELLHRAEETPETLRHNVTSPGGTTAEALKVLMAGGGWQRLMDRAIDAATRRSRELGG